MGIRMNTFAQQSRPQDPPHVLKERLKRRSDWTVLLVCVIAAVGGLASFVLLILGIGG
jgi:hypothetical protein